MIDPAAGSVLSIAEALTNIVWAPLSHGLKSVSLSANWMWPCKNPGEDARLYDAVKAASDFAIALGINIPTGKDSLSMTQKYPDGDVVYAPGTVIISAAGEVSNFRKVVEPVLKPIADSVIIYVPFTTCPFCLGGSSFAQVVNRLGQHVPTVSDAAGFSKAFEIVQELINEGRIIAGHDVSAGGLITTLLEMCFGRNDTAIETNITLLSDEDIVRKLFSERPAVVIQVADAKSTITKFKSAGVDAVEIGKLVKTRKLVIANNNESIELDINSLRDIWYRTSYLLDNKQTANNLARSRFENYAKQELQFIFPENFTGNPVNYGIKLIRRKPSGIKAAIIREKGVNGDREMAYSMYYAGLDVKDVHMTDLIAGRETLDDIHMIVFVGGFSNSDVFLCPTRYAKSRRLQWLPANDGIGTCCHRP
jgi:phosphoribosylformylglycinamidine synthase